MKRILAITLTLVMILAALTGCNASQPDNNSLNSEISQNELLKEGNVKSISVTSEPNGYEYSFSGDNVKAIVDYLSNLQLVSDFEENPNEYVGMTLVVSLEYDNGTTSTIYHFGNMFIRADNGLWYKMDFDEASRFHPLLQELSSSTDGEQPKTSQYLTEENGAYKLTLPNCKKEIELNDDEARFVPYITDELVEAAENKITQEVAEHNNNSGFYLQITEDYLCLTVEVIKYLDEPDESVGCFDHEHLFFSERISSQAVSDDKELIIGTSDEDYKKIQFFPQPILEFTEEKSYDTTKFEWTILTESDMDLLRQIYNDGKGWTNDSVVDREPFFFDGRIRFATTDSFGWMYFGFDQNVLYYNGMFTEINSKVMYIIERVQKTNNNGDNSSQDNEDLVSHIQIKSGDSTIHPFGSLFWSEIDNGDGTFAVTSTCRLELPDIINHYADDIPNLVLDERVSYFVQANGRVEKVYLLTPSGDTYTISETTFDALSNLTVGTYYVVLEVLLSGNCDPDAPQNSYRYEDVFCLVIESEDELTHSGYEVEIELLQYTWDGWGISTKTVGACDVAYNIIDALKAMKETGETVPKISDDVLEVGGGDYPAERGTMWIESSGKIYRLTPDLSQICLVETHFGEGKVLEMTDEFKTNVNNAWYYAPYDYYKGTYNKGDSTVELTSVFKSGSSIQLSIKEIKVDNSYDPHSTILIELISTADQEVAVKLHCRQSDDNLALGDDEIVELKKGVPTTVELAFGGWPDSTYWVYIEADFTKAEITINP